MSPADRPQLVQTESGLIQPGTPATTSVLIDPARRALFECVMHDDGARASLKSPSGRRIDESSPPSDVQVEASPPGACSEFFGVEARVVAFEVESPEPGEWTVEASVPAASDAVPYAVRGSVAGTAIQLDIEAEGGEGDPVRIRARLTREGHGLAGAVVRAFAYPEAAPPIVTDPTPTDASGGWSAELALAPGRYGLLVCATDHVGAAGTFRRTEETELFVTAGRLTPVLELARGVDLGGNGLFDVLRLRVSLVVPRGGRYAAGSRLEGGDGERITSGGVQLTLEPGRNTFEIDFDGALLRASAIDGPYRIPDISVVELHPPEGEPECHGKALDLRTGAFSAADFDPTPTLPGTRFDPRLRR